MSLAALVISAIMLACSIALVGYANGIADSALAQARQEAHVEVWG